MPIKPYIEPPKITKLNFGKIIFSRKPLSLNHLTKREKDVLRCIILGCTAKKTGQQLGISSRTVEVYVNTLKIKLNCWSKNEIPMKALENGLISILNIEEE